MSADLPAMIPQIEQMTETLNRMILDPDTTEAERVRAHELLDELDALAVEVTRMIRAE